MMEAKKTIAARFYQLKTGHALIAKYVLRIGKRSDMKCWWCGHQYQTRDLLSKWCKRWKREQKRLWVDGQDGEDGYEGVEKVLKRPKISLPMSLVFAEENCSQALMDSFPVQMLAELAEWWRRQKTQIMRSRVMGGCKS